MAYEGASWSDTKGAGPAAYVVVDDTPIPAGSQKLTTTVKAGTLSMSQAGDAVQLSAVDFGKGGASTGALRTVTVKDFRGGPAGWSLTGKVTDFTGPGAKIDAGKLSWTPPARPRRAARVPARPVRPVRWAVRERPWRPPQRDAHRW